MGTDVESVVIGGGVVGLAIARALLARGHEVLVLERQPRVGAEISSHNSEVVHAGLYYAPGSLKARLCVAGRTMLYAFAGDNGVALRRLGKLVVATSEEEIAALRAIAETARKNGVETLRALTGTEAREIEPELSCVGAYLSPDTGVIDSHGLVSALEGHVGAVGGSIVLNSAVTRLALRPSGGFAITVESQNILATISARRLVIAAGLGASHLGDMLGGKEGYRAPETYVAKGHYFTLPGKAPFRHLIYPLPKGGSLGIHLTLDVAGSAKFGPDIDWSGRETYEFEDDDGARMRHFEREVRRYWPRLPDGVLKPGYTGLRPKITRAGEAAADFAIHGFADHGITGLVALYGIESPGLTASLAIAEHVAGLAARS